MHENYFAGREAATELLSEAAVLSERALEARYEWDDGYVVMRRAEDEPGARVDVWIEGYDVEIVLKPDTDRKMRRKINSLINALNRINSALMS